MTSDFTTNACVFFRSGLRMKAAAHVRGKPSESMVVPVQRVVLEGLIKIGHPNPPETYRLAAPKPTTNFRDSGSPTEQSHPPVRRWSQLGCRAARDTSPELSPSQRLDRIHSCQLQTSPTS